MDHNRKLLCQVKTGAGFGIAIQNAVVSSKHHRPSHDFLPFLLYSLANGESKIISASSPGIGKPFFSLVPLWALLSPLVNTSFLSHITLYSKASARIFDDIQHSCRLGTELHTVAISVVNFLLKDNDSVQKCHPCHSFLLTQATSVYLY